MVDRGVDGRTVGTDGERPRRVAEELEDRERRPPEPAARRLRREHPDERARHALVEAGRHARRQILAAPRRRDERARRRCSREDDVARLVADEQRTDDARARDVDRYRSRRCSRCRRGDSRPRLRAAVVALTRDATAIGSSPTGISATNVRLAVPTAKTDSRLSGVLTAKSSDPSGESASGRVWALSKLTKSAAAPPGRGPASPITTAAT